MRKTKCFYTIRANTDAWASGLSFLDQGPSPSLTLSFHDVFSKNILVRPKKNKIGTQINTCFQKKFLEKKKQIRSKTFTLISLMPNQVAYERTGEGTWVVPLLVPEIFTDLS